MPIIRDTINPTREPREVSDEEALDLERMGLLLTGTRAKTPEGLIAAAIRQSSEVQADAFAAEAFVEQPAQKTDQTLDEHADLAEVEVTYPDGHVETVTGVLPATSAQEHDQDPGADPVSTTDDTPTDSQES